MNLIGCSFILGKKSIRKSNFSIGVFLSGSSGSIQKSTSGSIRIYPKKSGISGLLHHSIEFQKFTRVKKFLKMTDQYSIPNEI